MLDIRIEKTTNPKQLPAADNPLRFGTIFTDHMFIMNYETRVFDSFISNPFR